MIPFRVAAQSAAIVNLLLLIQDTVWATVLFLIAIWDNAKTAADWRHANETELTYYFPEPTMIQDGITSLISWAGLMTSAIYFSFTLLQVYSSVSLIMSGSKGVDPKKAVRSAELFRTICVVSVTVTISHHSIDMIWPYLLIGLVVVRSCLALIAWKFIVNLRKKINGEDVDIEHGAKTFAY